MRIVSLLPSATDIVVALGAGADLVGVSHSCSGDWDHLPKLTSTWIDVGASSAHIDEQVRTASKPLYELDIETLEALAPDVVISQSLCDVCAVPAGDVQEAILSIANRPTLVDLEPNRLADVSACFGQVGAALNRDTEASELMANWDLTLERFRGRYAEHELRVVFLDWLDPPFAAGHWIPDLLALLGIQSLLVKPGEPSHTVTWTQIRESHPDLVIAACCGFDVERIDQDLAAIDMPIISLDGHELFSRPSPALLPSLATLSKAVEEAIAVRRLS